ncbi:cache domain-containing sensor histidine kinase [Paenibacillus sp. Z6-24]
MKKWLERWKNMRLVNRLILMNTVLISIPLIISSWISSIGYSNSIQANVGRYQADVVREFTANTDAFMNELVLLSVTPYQSPELLNYLEQSGSHSREMDIYEQRLLLESFVRRILVNGRVDVTGVSLLSDHARSYVELPDSPGRFAEAADEERVLPTGTKLSGKGYFAAPHALLSDNGSTYEVFSIIRQIRSLENGRPLGTLVIDVPEEALIQRIRNLESSQTSAFAMVDQQGNYIYRSNAFVLTDQVLTGYRGEGTLTLDNDGQPVLLTYQTSPVTGWTVLQAVPLSVLLQDASRINQQMIWLGGLCLLLSVLLSVIHSMRITRPLSRLRDSMKLVERGQFDIELPARNMDEIGHLSRAFNMMVSRLGRLTYRLYETEIREKNAQIASLQSQINPHFLYNTLGSISMYAELEDNREIVQMTGHLSALLRYSIGGEHTDVTIAQELEHVRGYLAIQQIRYGERLSYEVDAPEQWLNCPMIRLALQPVVENAIVHGLERGRGDVHIVIRVCQEAGSVKMMVQDNGPGMEEHELAEQNDKMNKGVLPEGPGGHGLVNVHRRIVLKYGQAYGLRLHNLEEGGLQVSIIVPAALQIPDARQA